MATTKKSKAKVKVRDLKAKKNVKGGLRYHSPSAIKGSIKGDFRNR